MVMISSGFGKELASGVNTMSLRATATLAHKVNISGVSMVAFTSTGVESFNKAAAKDSSNLFQAGLNFAAANGSTSFGFGVANHSAANVNSNEFGGNFVSPYAQFTMTTQSGAGLTTMLSGQFASVGFTVSR
jgi:hypothetical protein